MDISAQKEDVKRKLIQKIIASLENGTLNEAELPLIGDFVLKNMPTVRSQADLDIFLDDFNKYWPVLSNLNSPAVNNNIVSAEPSLNNNEPDLKLFAQKIMEMK